MKKYIALILLVASVFLCTTSCGEEPVSAVTSACATLNELSQKENEKVTVEITTVTEDIRLDAIYTITSSKVEYSVDVLNKLSFDKDAGESYKKTLRGTANVENGVVTDIDGEKVDIPEYNDLRGKFDFDESNFEGATVEGGKLSAKVISPDKFFAGADKISDMSIKVEYSETAIKNIRISYTDGNTAVEMLYKF